MEDKCTLGRVSNGHIGAFSKEPLLDDFSVMNDPYSEYLFLRSRLRYSHEKKPSFGLYSENNIITISQNEKNLHSTEKGMSPSSFPLPPDVRKWQNLTRRMKYPATFLSPPDDPATSRKCTLLRTKKVLFLRSSPLYPENFSGDRDSESRSPSGSGCRRLPASGFCLQR